ncbi:MAG TPA: sigma-70 family RNA polymerase sigma factor [Nocardioidaceae bacterium]
MTELLPGVETPSDAELISRVRGGEVAAYGELFTRHVDAARRLARQLVRGPDVDDLVSDAFAKTLNVLQAGGGPDVAFRAYLLTSVRRLHVDRIRAAKKVQPSDDMTVYDDGLPFTDTAIASFENGAAAKAFSSLPERWQLVLWHLEVEGQKPAEIAPLLGMSANSVSALAYRAREGLRQAFLTMHLADCSTEQCRWVNQHLGAYVRKGLSRRDTAKVEQHLDECRRCTAMYLELTEVNSDLAAIIAPLLLGAAAAGYITSAGGTGMTGAAALFGRIRDALGAHGGSSTAGAGSSGASGGTAAAGSAVTAGTLTAGGAVAAGVVAITTAALLFGGGPGQHVADADRQVGTVQTRPGGPDRDVAAGHERRDASQTKRADDPSTSTEESANVVTVAADVTGDGPGDGSSAGGTSGAGAAPDGGTRGGTTVSPGPGSDPGPQAGGQDPAPVDDPLDDPLDGLPPLPPSDSSPGDGGTGTPGSGSSAQSMLTVAKPQIVGDVLLFEVTADEDLPTSVTVALTEAPDGVGFAPDAQSTITRSGSAGEDVLRVAIGLVGTDYLTAGTTLKFTVSADGYAPPTGPIEVTYSPHTDPPGSDGDSPSPAADQVTGISVSGRPTRRAGSQTLWDVTLSVTGLPADAELTTSDLRLLAVPDSAQPGAVAPETNGSFKIVSVVKNDAGAFVVTLHVPRGKGARWFVLEVTGSDGITTEPFQVGAEGRSDKSHREKAHAAASARPTAHDRPEHQGASRSNHPSHAVAHPTPQGTSRPKVRGTSQPKARGTSQPKARGRSQPKARGKSSVLSVGKPGAKGGVLGL